MAQTGKRYVPSKSDKQYVFECASAGISVTKILDGLHIDYKTWIKNLPKFSKYLKRGKTEFDKHLDRIIPDVENSLIKRCLGFEFDEVTTRQKGKVIDGKLINGQIEKTITKKIMPASDAAIIFFLCNRDMKKWRNSYRVDHTTNGKELSSLSSDQIFEKISTIAAKVKQGQTNE